MPQTCRHFKFSLAPGALMREAETTILHTEMFCQQSDRTHSKDSRVSQYFLSKNRNFFLEQNKTKHFRQCLLQSPLLPLLVWMTTPQSYRRISLEWNVAECLEIHADIWSPSEGTWTEAKDGHTKKNTTWKWLHYDGIITGYSAPESWLNWLEQFYKPGARYVYLHQSKRKYN